MNLTPTFHPRRAGYQRQIAIPSFLSGGSISATNVQDAVQSVNGMTGHVVLDASDVGAIPIPMCVWDGRCYPPRPNAAVVLYFGPHSNAPTDGQTGDYWFPS